MKRAKHIKMTEREFRAWKRRHFRAVQKAWEEFRLGSAYLPRMPMYNIVEENLDEIAAVCNPWWRKA